jgi:NADPH-dependent curcumin reductase CurA
VFTAEVVFGELVGNVMRYAGNVGALAVQMAHAAGAMVIAIWRSGDAGYLRSIGADVVGDYTAGAFARVLDRSISSSTRSAANSRDDRLR